MNSMRGAVLLGDDARERWPAVGGLVNRFGEPFTVSPLTSALLVEEAIGPDGRPLFPHAPSPAQLVGEQVAPERAWVGMRPGAELGTELADLDPRQLGEEALVEAARAHARMIAHHEAGLSRMLAELTNRLPYQVCSNSEENPHDALRAAASEMSLAMSWTPSHADARMVHAVSLAADLPVTLAALEAGRIDAYKARIIDDETVPLRAEPELRRHVESAALAVAEAKTGPALRAYLKRAVLAAAPEQAEQRRQAATKARMVTAPFPEADGMASMHLRGPVEDLAAFWTALDAAARARRDAAAKNPAHRHPGICLEQLRFDVLADLGWSALAAGHLGCCNPGCCGLSQRLGTRQGRPATVHVTMPITTLLGLDDLPAELDGFGPITPDAARAIAADATWRRLLTDPATGALLDYGHTTYTPPQTLREFVIARDRTCRFPTCSWPARSSQLDHTDPHRPDGTGGATADHNLGPLHGRHHNDKTHHGFTFTQPAPGQFVITTPAGLIYQVDPEIIGPGHDPPADRDTNPDPPVVDDQHPDDDPPPF